LVLEGTIILTCQSAEAGEKTLVQLCEVKGATVQLKHLYLTSLKSVYQFVKDLGQECQHSVQSCSLLTFCPIRNNKIQCIQV
jgi:hypothetical protein